MIIISFIITIIAIIIISNKNKKIRQLSEINKILDETININIIESKYLKLMIKK